MASELLNLFTKLIWESFPRNEKYEMVKIGNVRRYYHPNDWKVAERAKVFFDCQPKFLFGNYPKDSGSKELEGKTGQRLPFCSFASSANLCYQDFVEVNHVQNIALEVPMPNDFCPLAPTWMDAVSLPVCYECKCQEIIDGEHETLRKSYWLHKNSKLFQEFEIPLDEEKNVKKKYKKSGKLNYEWLDFPCSDLNIDLPQQYHELHFNLKQLICHLIAIANSDFNPPPRKLQYVIYVPRLDLINSHPEIKGFYRTFIREVDLIWAPKTSISAFAKKHRIELPRPLFKTVSDLKTVEAFESLYR